MTCLVQKRSVWVPTWLGWLIALACLGATLLYLLHHLQPFLAPNEPVGARLLVVEGWLTPAELDQAVQIYRTEGYDRIVTTGGPIPDWADRLGQATYAELAADYLHRRGMPVAGVIAVPAPASGQDRTFLSAVMVREWAKQSWPALDKLDVLSSGVHCRRSRLLYRMAFGPGVEVGIRAAQPDTYDARAWWETSAGAKSVLSESVSWIWTKLLFSPGSPGSHEEKWGGPPVR